ncbi:MAG: hypothetical protein JWL99_4061 [Streptomyces oryziradicis]|nr:hypothetical protein [Actinacidiphila oryziradicis]
MFTRYPGWVRPIAPVGRSRALRLVHSAAQPLRADPQLTRDLGRSPPGRPDQLHRVPFELGRVPLAHVALATHLPGLLPPGPIRPSIRLSRPAGELQGATSRPPPTNAAPKSVISMRDMLIGPSAWWPAAITPWFSLRTGSRHRRRGCLSVPVVAGSAPVASGAGGVSAAGVVSPCMSAPRFHRVSISSLVWPSSRRTCSLCSPR